MQIMQGKILPDITRQNLPGPSFRFSHVCCYSFLLLILLCPVSLKAWGFWAHQRINRLAVFTLPPELISVYKEHIDYLTEHAVDPDMRRYAVDGEAARHYIDVDHYGHYPFDNVPRNWSEAVNKFSADTLEAYGILPYQLPRRIKELERAFREKDLTRIIRLSADIGHYIGDAHVPLHTTENYNGQLTGQKGIHGFWESRLPELFAEEYDFFVGKCYFIESIYKEAWTAVLESHVAVDSVLSMERELTRTHPSDQKFGYESRNSIIVRTYSRSFSEAYHNMLNGMVERRMRKSILRIGSYWYTAWKNAGSPDLSELVGQKLRFKPIKYKKRLKIKDREDSSIGMIHMLRKANFYYADRCCRFQPTIHTVSYTQSDPHHQQVVAMLKSRRKAELHARKLSVWKRFKSWFSNLWA